VDTPHSDPHDLVRIFRDIDAGFGRLAVGLAGPAAASAGAVAALDLGVLFAQVADNLAAQLAARAVPDEFVIDDDGPRAGVMRRATPADYADPEDYGREPHYETPGA
jgi:hypothetical protein